MQVQPSRTLSTATSWAARAAASTVPAAAPPQPAAVPPPPGEHTEDEWPTLPGAASLPVLAGSDASAMDMAQVGWPDSLPRKLPPCSCLHPPAP